MLPCWSNFYPFRFCAGRGNRTGRRLFRRLPLHVRSFARRKPGHLLFPGRALGGVVTVADIGIADETIAALSARAFANGPELWAERFPRPEASAHKYDRGHALVLSGGGVAYGRGAARA